MIRLGFSRAVLVAVGLGLFACGSSTTMEQTWKEPGVPAVNLHKVVTVYLSGNGTMRRSVEDTMTSKLTKSGVSAAPAYAVLSDSDLKNHDQAKAKLKAAGFDGVIAIRLVSNTTTLVPTPDNFDAYWGTAWPYAYNGGLETEQVVRVETTVYSLDTNKRVWSGVSKTVDPNDPTEVMRDVTSVVAKALNNQRIVNEG